MIKLPIYLDNHSTTQLDPRVLEAMLPYLREDFGNAASKTHVFGWKAEAAVEQARRQVAELIGAAPQEIVFTSGATESDNLALKGVAEAYSEKGDHLITVQTEHKAVLDSCQRLERVRRERRELMVGWRREISNRDGADERELDPTLESSLRIASGGARATYLPVRRDGSLDLRELREALEERTILVSAMLANNETGVLHPVDQIGAICREAGVLFHCDAVQGIGKVPFEVEGSSADLVSLSAHKIYGPKGIGALYVRRRPRVRMTSLIDGGGHERGLRSGTLNVPAIVGFGKAAEIGRLERTVEAERVAHLRDRLQSYLTENVGGVHVNGALDQRVAGNLNVSFEGVESDALMLAMKEIAVSAGSSCTSASLEPSYVLRAMGVPPELARGSIRFGIGRFNTEEEIDFVGARVLGAVKELRRQHDHARSVHLMQ